MLRDALTAVSVLLIITAPAGGTDLYKVTVDSRLSALTLSRTGVEGMVKLSDSYLVLADSASAIRATTAPIPTTLINTMRISMVLEICATG